MKTKHPIIYSWVTRPLPYSTWPLSYSTSERRRIRFTAQPRVRNAISTKTKAPKTRARVAFDLHPQQDDIGIVPSCHSKAQRSRRLRTSGWGESDVINWLCFGADDEGGGQ